MKNSIDKLAEQFTSIEELQAYCDSQYKTILNLNQKINAQEKELEKLREVAAKLQSDLAIASAGKKDEAGQFSTSDEETTCVIQIAMLKAHAMQRELITDEVKRLEILVKTLLAVRGREVKPKKGESPDNLSPEELLKQLDNLSKDPQ